MKVLLEKKLEDLNNRESGENWYVVKQEADFVDLCYLIDALIEFKKNGSKSPQEYIKTYIENLNDDKNLEITGNHRALRMGYFLGLLIPPVKSTAYKGAEPTEVYWEIKRLTDGDYSKTGLYEDIIMNQVEKLFVSSSLDENTKSNGKNSKNDRKNFKLYPIVFIYKILLSIGDYTGDYTLTNEELYYFIYTCEKYKDAAKATSNILEYRLSDEVETTLFREKFDEFKKKFDNRLNVLFKILETLNTGSDGSITLKSEFIKRAREIVYRFEKNKLNDKFNEDKYFELLRSNISMLDYLKEMDSDSATKIKSEDTIFNHNRIVFGAPGTGKSYKLDEDKEVFDENYERVTFHPNYSYGNFVGSYKPVMVEDSIRYEYQPGPFIRVLVKALKDRDTDFLLLIEEINRANVAATFGDVFQLLDRKNGESEYPITASEDLKKYLNSEGIKVTDEIRIPSNMYIWASMNSADQGVFPVDTAFKRRWNFEYLGIDEGEKFIENIKVRLGNDEHTVHWNAFRKEINSILSKECNLNEDKLIGPFFIYGDILDTEEDGYVKDNEKFLEVFKNKVLFYLFDDAAKYKRKILFKESSGANQYSQVCEDFDELGERLFGLDLVTLDESDSEEN